MRTYASKNNTELNKPFLSNKQQCIQTITYEYPTELIWLGNTDEFSIIDSDAPIWMWYDSDIDKEIEIPLQVVDNVTEESLERKPGYRYSLIVLNDMDSMLNLSDEEYATVFQCYLRDEFCIVACVGKNHFSKLVKLGLIKNEKWIQPEDYCVFYHRSKSGKMTSTFGLYTETDIENDFSMCMCLLQGFKSIVEDEK